MYDAALGVMLGYFTGEMDYGDAPAASTAPPDDDRAPERVPVTS